MVRQIAFLILVFLCIRAQVRAQETSVESNIDEPVVVQDLIENTDNSTESEESKESKEVELERTPKKIVWTCGLRKINGLGSYSDDTVTDFETTKFGEFAWMVTLSEVIEVDVYNFVCTGALVSSKAVATTAHCVQRFKNNPESLAITAGLWNSTERNQMFLPQRRLAQRIVTLEHFDKDFHMNDIAIVVVETPFDLMEHIQPICLPPITESFEGQSCLLNYWNVESDNVSLKKSELSVVASSQCQIKLNAHKATQDLPIHESLICAVSERNIGECDQQFGAPLICLIQGVVDRYYLAGLSSVSYGCNTDTYTGLFVNVALLRRWITAEIAD